MTQTNQSTPPSISLKEMVDELTSPIIAMVAKKTEALIGQDFDIASTLNEIQQSVDKMVKQWREKFAPYLKQKTSLERFDCLVTFHGEPRSGVFDLSWTDEVKEMWQKKYRLVFATFNKFSVGNIVRHVKSGGDYMVVGLPENNVLEHDRKPSYAYLMKDRRVCHRAKDEFEDGRFVLVEKPADLKEWKQRFLLDYYSKAEAVLVALHYASENPSPADASAEPDCSIDYVATPKASVQYPE